MVNLTEKFKEELLTLGADFVGFGDLQEIPFEDREGFPIGISVAVKLPKDIIRGISDLPTKEYYDTYHLVNGKLDEIVENGAEYLRKQGYKAVAKTRGYVGDYGEKYITRLPHKTIATRAGLGWIGKSALLVNEKFGSMIRYSSILTDASLTVGTPINTSKCGNCQICKNACPGDVISGENWNLGTERAKIFNAKKCDETMQERSLKGYNIAFPICGKCIYVCPYTQKYLKED